MKISRAAEKESIIGGRNDVEEFLDSKIFAGVLDIGDVVEGATICKEIGQQLGYVGCSHSRHARHIIEIVVVAHERRD